jgi:hypothetical protein
MGKVGISHPPIKEVKMATIVKSLDWKIVNDGVRPDSRRRIVLPNALVAKGVIFHAYYNSSGQILLDPQVTIPLSEAWLFNNPDALALVKQGLLDVAQGKVSKVDLDTL